MPGTQREDRGAWARRHNHALVALAREVWHDGCTLDGALGLICETAAATLEVERVNVWRVHPRQQVLRCVHAYERDSRRHNPPGYDVAFDAGVDYVRALDEVRVFQAVDVARDAVLSASWAALGEYLQRHGVQSLLDAPVRTAGELLGVVCHEQVGRARLWRPEDEAFAASIGDFAAMAIEIDRRRAAERRLLHLQRHDPQTELPNRDHLLEVAHTALRPAQGRADGIAAIHLKVEETPHDARDDGVILGAVAERLRDALGDSASLARVRSDGFALLPHRQLREAEALDLAERCIELAREGAADAGTGHVVISAGIAFSRDLATPTADALLGNAELASQRARSGGRDRCAVFDVAHHRGLLARIDLEQALREALDGDGFEVHYQPEVDLVDGQCRAAEALLRWRGGDGRLRPAQEFMEVAEGSGLVVALGRRVLERACAAAGRWPAREGAAPLLRVNVSARQFEQARLHEDVANALAASGLAPSRLCLELTETALLRDPAAAAAGLARLRALGVGIALDDFGTGYSSLSYLKHLPIDAIKLDRGFVAGLPEDRHDLAIVRAVAGLARDIGLDVVAEGVETQAQAAALRECGIRRAQGYLFAPALADAALLDYLAPHAAA
ncbi:MAG TPA: GGDEF and EAL domain-containing protein [Luteimonas sp.]|nr:GGDEF and EAL domain-containing protein [Luteimonas sp.]